jgi:hypothetical protein
VPIDRINMPERKMNAVNLTIDFKFNTHREPLSFPFKKTYSIVRTHFVWRSVNLFTLNEKGIESRSEITDIEFTTGLQSDGFSKETMFRK